MWKTNIFPRSKMSMDKCVFSTAAVGLQIWLPLVQLLKMCPIIRKKIYGQNTAAS